MSYTKYVMGADDKFALISKMTGVEHTQLAGELGGVDKIVTAGFVFIDDDGKLVTYGKSYSLGIASSPEDGPVILAAINRGVVKILEDKHNCVFLATNSPSSDLISSAPIATIENLREHRIFEPQ